MSFRSAVMLLLTLAPWYLPEHMQVHLLPFA
jgi:hypothetical protein